MAEKDDRRAIGFSFADFNSNTQLNEKNDRHFTGDTENESEYDPFKNRVVAKPNSIFGSLVHMLKSALGTGIFAMPLAFRNGGILFGVIGTIVIGFLATLCMHMLVKTSQEICRKTKTPALGYSETAGKVFENGPMALRPWSNFAKQFCDYAMMSSIFGTSCVYIIFISESIHDVVNFEVGIDWDIRIYIALMLVPLIIMGQIRVLKYLVPFSAIGNAMIIIVFGITMYYVFNEPLQFDDKPLFASWGSLPYFFSTVIFAMDGISAVMPVENDMKKPQHYLGCPGVLNTAMITLIVLYSAIGLIGYVRFGEEVKGSVTLNLPEGMVLAQIAQILIAVAILFSFGLYFYIAMDILWRKISHKVKVRRHNITQILMRTIVICLMAGIAVAVPNLGPFIGLVGAIFFPILGIFVPSVVETVFLWPNMGRFYWKLIKNVFLTVLGTCALVAGTVVNIEDIVGMYA